MYKWHLKKTVLTHTGAPAAGLRVLDGLSPEEAGLKPKEYYRYSLAGVLVHSGTADAGHYYTYVKRRDYDTREAGKQGQQGGSSGSGGGGGGGGGAADGFFSFDDTRVETYDLGSQLEQDCFGGKATHHQWDPTKRQSVQREYMRVNSAYMLLYEREWVGDAEAEREDDQRTREEAAAKQAEEAAKKAAEEEAAAAAAAKVEAEGDTAGDEAAATAAQAEGDAPAAAADSDGADAAAITAAADSAPAAASAAAGPTAEKTTGPPAGGGIAGPEELSAEVSAQNLQYRHDQQVLNNGHFQFVRKLATANNPLVLAAKQQQQGGKNKGGKADADTTASSEGRSSAAAGTQKGAAAAAAEKTIAPPPDATAVGSARTDGAKNATFCAIYV